MDIRSSCDALHTHNFYQEMDCHPLPARGLTIRMHSAHNNQNGYCVERGVA